PASVLESWVAFATMVSGKQAARYLWLIPHRRSYPDAIHFESIPVSPGCRMSTGNGRPLGRPKNLNAAPLQPGDVVGAFTYAQLLRMDRRYVAATEEAIRLRLERRTSAFAEQRTGTSNRAGGMETGIYGATLQWARVGVIMVVCSWHNALGAAQLPREIV